MGKNSSSDWRARCKYCGGIIYFGDQHGTREECIDCLKKDISKLKEDIDSIKDTVRFQDD
jgi:hypothetical protein